MLRDRWPTRAAFVFAAIGSAAGLGNLWRFPYLTYKYGGGAFLLPYLIALFVTGIPLLILEFALGQKFQKGAVDAFAAIKPALSGVGWWAIISSFLIISYYGAVMGWALIYLVASFGVKWGAHTKDYFFDEVLQISPSISNIGGISWPLIIALFIAWLLIYLCIFKGVKSVSKVVMVTVPLPIILIIILVIRAVTLPGSAAGIVFYLKPCFKALLDTEVWIAAFSQIFFTLSLSMGIMIAYASYQKRRADVTKNAIITAVANSGISILAGFAVFGTLGYMAQRQGVAVPEVVRSGLSLAFVAFPKALSLMPLPTVFSIIFFLTLVSLAIDSAFSLVEAISTVISDRIENAKREIIAAIVCLLGFVAGIVYTTGAGLYFLDIVDHFITNFSLVAVGILECIIIGWIFGAKRLREFFNTVSDFKIGVWWDISIKFITPIVLIVILVMQLIKELSAPYEGYPNWAICLGWSVVAVPLIISFLIRQKKVKAVILQRSSNS